MGTEPRRRDVEASENPACIHCLEPIRPDRQGSVVDAFTARSSGLVVPAGSETAFRVVESQLLGDPAQYVRCEVAVRWAQRAE